MTEVLKQWYCIVGRFLSNTSRLLSPQVISIQELHLCCTINNSQHTGVHVGCKEDAEIGGMDMLDLVMIYFLSRQIHIEYLVNVNYT